MGDAGLGPRLDEPVRTALGAVAERLAEYRIDYALGGSLLLRLSGYDLPVGDIDLVTASPAAPVVAAMAGWQPTIREPRSAPWDSEWFATARWSDGAAAVGIDIIGGPVIVVGAHRARLPTDPVRTVGVDGHRIPLGDVGAWYHVYRVIDPPKADLVARLVSGVELAAIARRMGLPAS